MFGITIDMFKGLKAKYTFNHQGWVKLIKNDNECNENMHHYSCYWLCFQLIKCYLGEKVEKYHSVNFCYVIATNYMLQIKIKLHVYVKYRDLLYL